MNAPSSMTASEWLRVSQKHLQAAGIDTARLDVLVLLSDELGRDKSWILSYPEYELKRSEIENLSTKIAQRAKHTPLAYLRERAEFYGREFAIDEHVLVPRPESEAMIELLKQGVGRRASGVVIMDVGTGSGCLAVTAKLEVPDAKVVATDIDPCCLKLAAHNATCLHADVTFLEGDLLTPVLRNPKPDVRNPLIILANLPYVPVGYPVNEAARHEPALALFSGPDGLDHYRQFFTQIDQLEHKPTHIITESLLGQHNELARIAKVSGYGMTAEQDFAQCFTRPDDRS